MGRRQPTRAWPVAHCGKKQRTERSEIAKGRSLCPQGSAGGRWQISAVPELLRRLELADGIVTLDAMGCQKTIARKIQEADADYVLAFKANHELPHEEIQTFLDGRSDGRE